MSTPSPRPAPVGPALPRPKANVRPSSSFSTHSPRPVIPIPPPGLHQPIHQQNPYQYQFHQPVMAHRPPVPPQFHPPYPQHQSQPPFIQPPYYQVPPNGFPIQHYQPPHPNQVHQYHVMPPPPRPIIMSNPNPYIHWQPPPMLSPPNTQMTPSFPSTSLNTTPEPTPNPQISSTRASSTSGKPSVEPSVNGSTSKSKNGITEKSTESASVSIKGKEIKGLVEDKKKEKEKEKGEKKMDLYASIYVPAWLLEVNQDEAFFQVPHQAPEPFDNLNYASKFLTKHILEDSEQIEAEAESEGEETYITSINRQSNQNQDANVNEKENSNFASPKVTDKNKTSENTNQIQIQVQDSEKGSYGFSRILKNNNVNKEVVKKPKVKNTKVKKENFSDDRDFDPTLVPSSSISSSSSQSEAEEEEEAGGENGWSKMSNQSSFLQASRGSKVDWGGTSSIGAIAQGTRGSSGQSTPAIAEESSSISMQIESLLSNDSLGPPPSTAASDLPIDPNRFPPLEPSTYSERFEKLLNLEIESRIFDLSKQSLFVVSLKPYNPKDQSLGLWTLDLPGIREDRPHLSPNDRVELRALASISKSWLKLSFDAHITSVRALEGKIVLECKELEASLKNYYPKVENAKFNVIFHPRLKNELDAIESLKILESALKRNHRVGSVLKRWLFPSEEHSLIENYEEKLWEGEIKYFDERLNEEQRDAVEKISSRKHRIPYLISGPPGTGKTKTVVEATLQILLRQPQSTILLVAPSNTAADTLALRLSDNLKQGDMIRINDPSRTFAEVPEMLMLYCSIDEEKSTFCLPDFKDLMKARVIVTTTFDASLLVKARVTNSDLARLNTAVSPAIKPKLSLRGNESNREEEDEGVPHHFNFAIIDEVAQGMEAELSSVLAVILPSRYSDRKTDPVLVLCGDSAQLGPRIQSHEARSNGLDISILERLWERPVYKSAMQRLRQGRRKSTLKSLNGEANRIEGIIGKEKICAQLVQNYRATHPALLMVPSSLFYNDTLRPADLRSSELRNWSGLPMKGFPLVFEGVEGEEKWVDEGVSWHNPAEVKKVVELIQSLTGIYRDPDELTTRNEHQWVSPKDIAVISPYREQVWRLRLALRKRGLSAVMVGNIEVFQGAEHLVTIISTVRSRERFLKDDMKNNLGLMFERKRFCVATTRAKELLIVVGNGNLLKNDPYWRTFLELVIRKKSFTGPKIDGIDPLSASDVSALEVLYADEMKFGEDGKEISELEREEEKAQQTAGRVIASAMEDTEGEW